MRQTTHPVRSPALALATLTAATFAATLALAAPLAAQRPMTVEDVLAMRQVSDPVISPDGRWVAYAVSERDMEANERSTHLWLVPADGSADPIQLTNGPEGDRSPQWAPDGSWLAFLSDRGETTQVWGIRPSGGEAWAVTELETEVRGFRLSPDGRRIAFIAPPETPEMDEEREAERGRPIVWDSVYTDQWNRLWTAPVRDRRAEDSKLSAPIDLHVTDVVWAPNGVGLAFAARPSPILRTFYDGAVYLQDSPGGRTYRLTDMEGGEGVEAWIDGLGVLVSGTGHRLGTFNSELWAVSPDDGETRLLTGALDEHASLVLALPDGIYVEVQRGTGRGLDYIALRNGRPAGEPEALTDDRRHYSAFSATPFAGTVAFIAQGADTPPDVHVSPVRRWSPRRLTELNPQVEELALGESRVVRWQSRADGEAIEGLLTLPVDYERGDRVPLLLRIHGGPSGVSARRFTGMQGAYPTQVFAGMGYAVLQPNYRGSTGYGERFRGLNRGDISGRDWVDIDSGVDHLIAEGIADPDALGIMGWSFGGHHTYWGITQTDRYAAASAGAGANDLISMYSQTDIPEFYHTYLGPKPWEDFELYEERSAYRYVENVTTPLLIQVGEDDERVPAEQSIQFYEAVKVIGKAPVKLVVYPGQPHGIREPVLQRDRMMRNVEWFARWMPVAGRDERPGGG